MPGNDPSPLPGSRTFEELAVQAVQNLVADLVPQVGYVPDHDLRGEAPRNALRRLRVLTALQHAVSELEGEAARDAAAAGAGYPQIGEATHLSRQGARRRWPGLITHDGRPCPPLVPRSTTP